MTEITSAVEETETAIPEVPRLTITDITFQEGKLWKPRYESLFHYVSEDLQLEPAFQVLSPDPDLEIEVLFEIREDQRVWFESEDGEPGKVRCRTIERPSAIPEQVSVTFAGGENRSCLLRWKRSIMDSPPPRVTTFRIFCGQEGPKDVFTQVEGGLYLSIIYKPKAAPPLSPVRKQSSRSSRAVKVIGFDKHGRPTYDLFRPDPDSIPAEIELEPAVRAREGDLHHLDLELDVPGLVFETEAPAEPPGKAKAKVYPYHPEQRPRQLVRAETRAGDKICELEWKQGKDRKNCRVGSTSPRCYLGATATFFLKARAEDAALENVAAAAASLDIDPTVIQPPVCNGDVCLPPPNDPASGPRD